MRKRGNGWWESPFGKNNNEHKSTMQNHSKTSVWEEKKKKRKVQVGETENNR